MLSMYGFDKKGMIPHKGTIPPQPWECRWRPHGCQSVAWGPTTYRGRDPGHVEDQKSSWPLIDRLHSFGTTDRDGTGRIYVRHPTPYPSLSPRPGGRTWPPSEAARWHPRAGRHVTWLVKRRLGNRCSPPRIVYMARIMMICPAAEVDQILWLECLTSLAHIIPPIKSKVQ